MTAPTSHQVAQARRWMGALPREQFEHLLLLCNESHARGCRETQAADAAFAGAYEAKGNPYFHTAGSNIAKAILAGEPYKKG